MQKIDFDFAVIGGDARQVYLASRLSKQGFRVCAYALCSEQKQPNVLTASSLEDAVAHSETILAPVPISKDRQNISQQAKACDLSMSHLLNALLKNQRLFAGCIPADFQAAAAAKGVLTYDLMKAGELAVFNTIATAEGALAEAICKSSQNLHHSCCMVLGFGRCARTLTGSLKGLGAQVTVCARNAAARAEAELNADNAIPFSQLGDCLPEYDFLFNTVPALVLTKENLSKLKPGTLIIDIASSPGGVDYAAARELGVSAWLCPGLPGKYSPESSANAIADTVLSQIRSFEGNA